MKKSPFPDNLRVAVLNDNPDLDYTDCFDGQQYRFPPGEVVTIPAPVAWFFFAYETRPDPNTGEPRAFRDKHTGATAKDPSWYESRLVRLGWTRDDPKDPDEPDKKPISAKHKRQWFANFRFQVIQIKSRMSKAEFEGLKKNGA
jgi:hypothetical protein